MPYDMYPKMMNPGGSQMASAYVDSQMSVQDRMMADLARRKAQGTQSDLFAAPSSVQAAQGQAQMAEREAQDAHGSEESILRQLLRKVNPFDIVSDELQQAPRR